LKVCPNIKDRYSTGKKKVGRGQCFCIPRKKKAKEGTVETTTVAGGKESENSEKEE